MTRAFWEMVPGGKGEHGEKRERVLFLLKGLSLKGKTASAETESSPGIDFVRPQSRQGMKKPEGKTA